MRENQVCFVCVSMFVCVREGVSIMYLCVRVYVSGKYICICMHFPMSLISSRNCYSHRKLLFTQTYVTKFLCKQYFPIQIAFPT